MDTVKLARIEELLTSIILLLQNSKITKIDKR
ncbi:hypothetical protein JOC28_002043 [Streptococcus loxodontisalivarius]|uniref:Uncharacterized protein n=1 Tax=Streptococcus loxodontisalivarius TaxID=1349415 RepID=A0ABS2PWR5_9STRE|nr:hypothetical protein [Streptococcus loxodontisalivarius]